MRTPLTETAAWKELKARATTSRELFGSDPQRQTKYTHSLSGLTIDLSRQRLTDETLSLLIKLAEERNLEEWRAKMLRGEKINNTENRAVLHTALRTNSNAPILVEDRDIIPEIRALQKRMEIFTAEVREGRWRGATGQPVKDIVNIGIGGSDLGPRLAVGALKAFTKDGPRAHFVANADAADILDALDGLNPETTLFVVVSKTFTTQETLLNAATARQWLVDKLGEEAVTKHFVVVSTNLKAAGDFGIAEDNIFPMWDWVGGRYSLWSSAGLSVALTIGWSNFKELLGGAAEMDEHFSTAPSTSNLPILMALAGIWNRNFEGSSCLAILPYSERLRDLPRYLQQLEMESNGKSVTRDGQPVDYATAPAIIGECGTIGQHSFHQWLHQGTEVTPCDFIGIREDDLGQPDHHRALLANLNAQAEALNLGRRTEDPHRTNPGNRPATILWLDRLDPQTLGQLLALYEHKVFVQGIIWDINSFDQWGVELGKTLAKKVLSQP